MVAIRALFGARGLDSINERTGLMKLDIRIESYECADWDWKGDAFSCEARGYPDGASAMAAADRILEERPALAEWKPRWKYIESFETRIPMISAVVKDCEGETSLTVSGYACREDAERAGETLVKLAAGEKIPLVEEDAGAARAIDAGVPLRASYRYFEGGDGAEDLDGWFVALEGVVDMETAKAAGERALALYGKRDEWIEARPLYGEPFWVASRRSLYAHAYMPGEDVAEIAISGYETKEDAERGAFCMLQVACGQCGLGGERYDAAACGCDDGVARDEMAERAISGW